MKPILYNTTVFNWAPYSRPALLHKEIYPLRAEELRPRDRRGRRTNSIGLNWQ
jgi:hypothetical protein